MIMLFHEIYSTYFQTVGKILTEEINLDHSKAHEEQDLAGGLKIRWVADGRRNICQKCFVEKGCV